MLRSQFLISLRNRSMYRFCFASAAESYSEAYANDVKFREPENHACHPEIIVVAFEIMVVIVVLIGTLMNDLRDLHSFFFRFGRGGDAGLNTLFFSLLALTHSLTPLSVPPTNPSQAWNRQQPRMHRTRSCRTGTRDT